MLKYREFPINQNLIELYRLLEVIPYHSEEHDDLLNKIDRLESMV